MTSQQLVLTLDADSDIPVVYNGYEKKYRYRHVPDYPIVHWPSGFPCVEANLFLLSGYLSKNWSVKHDGGTIGSYASNLSHIIRYCYDNRIYFTDLTDIRIESFINGLMAERKKNNLRKRSNTTVNKIGRETLSFLIFLGKKLGCTSFIGTKGCRVNYSERVYKDNNISRTYVTHYSFPSKDPYKKRLPFASSDLEKLLLHIRQSSEKYVELRDTCLIKMLKATGGRRSEIVNLRVIDIKNALSSNDPYPMLRLITLKQRKNEEIVREIPVYRATLREVNKYINKVRSRIIKKIKENSNESFKDHGYVFISETTGEQLKPGTITTYFNTWAKEIGAEGNVVAHAFRHAYITEKIEILIRQFNLQDESDLKDKFATEKSFEIKLLEWTGHKSVKSLTNYIHLAFDGLSGVSVAFDKLTLVQGVQSAKDELTDLKNRIIRKQVTSADALVEIEQLIEDLTALIK
tara:strand:- start:1644 stop:3029 length:1386 start_codon:yes stop_codon:yes gene_type:complete